MYLNMGNKLREILVNVADIKYKHCNQQRHLLQTNAFLRKENILDDTFQRSSFDSMLTNMGGKSSNLSDSALA